MNSKHYQIVNYNVLNTLAEQECYPMSYAKMRARQLSNTLNKTFVVVKVVAFVVPSAPAPEQRRAADGGNSPLPKDRTDEGAQRQKEG